jgi:hypothetical protein
MPSNEGRAEHGNNILTIKEEPMHSEANAYPLQHLATEAKPPIKKIYF